MNIKIFGVDTTNIFPMSNDTNGGQLLSERNIRSCDSVIASPTDSEHAITYRIGPSYARSEDDFGLSSSSDLKSLIISYGIALVNGHFVESSIDESVDLSQYNLSAGTYIVGLKAVYSTAGETDGTLLVESTSKTYSGIQLVILPSIEFILPTNSPNDESKVTAHLKLGSFTWSGTGIVDIYNNYPDKCAAFDASRIFGYSDPSAHYISKDSLDPTRHYVVSGKDGQLVDDYMSDFIWSSSSPSATTMPPRYNDARFIVSEGTVKLYVPRRQPEGGMENILGESLYYPAISLDLPNASYSTATPGILTSEIIQQIKSISRQLSNFTAYLAPGSSLRAIVNVLTDRNNVPYDATWSAGDYVLVLDDRTLATDETTSAIPTIYIVGSGYVTAIGEGKQTLDPNTDVEFVYEGSPKRYATGIDKHNILSAAQVSLYVFGNGKDMGVEYSRISCQPRSSDGKQNYLQVQFFDVEAASAGTPWSGYYPVTASMPRGIVGPIQLGKEYGLATTTQVGGFYDAPSGKIDQGYVVLDSDGHLRLLDYGLLRSGELAYQLSSDVTVNEPSYTSTQTVLDETVNQRIAFRAESSGIDNPQYVTVTITVPESTSDNIIYVQNIDSRFDTALHLQLICNENVNANTTIKIVECPRIKVTVSGQGSPNINIERCGVYYDASLFNMSNISFSDISLWYVKYSSLDPNISVDGMTVRSNMPAGTTTVQSNGSNTSLSGSPMFAFGLESLTFDGSGQIIRAGIYAKNSSSAYDDGNYATIYDIKLPTTAELSYPAIRFSSDVKLYGTVISAYPLIDSPNVKFITTGICAQIVSPSTISATEAACSIGITMNVQTIKLLSSDVFNGNPDHDSDLLKPWATSDFSIISGGVIDEFNT